MKATIQTFLLCALSLGAHAQTTASESQARAIAKYPALGISGSELNKRFVESHAKLQKEAPATFRNPNWPLLLAEQLVGKKQNISPASKPVVLPENLRKAAEECFAQGYAYFIWPAQAGPFRQADSEMFPPPVPFYYIASGHPVPYHVVITIRMGKEPGGEMKIVGPSGEGLSIDFESKTDKVPSITGGGDVALLGDAKKFVRGSKGKAEVYLMGWPDRGSKKQISNRFTIEVEL